MSVRDERVQRTVALRLGGISDGDAKRLSAALPKLSEIVASKLYDPPAEWDAEVRIVTMSPTLLDAVVLATLSLRTIVRRDMIEVDRCAVAAVDEHK